MFPTAVAIGALCTMNVAVGWLLGYHAAAAYLECWLLGGLAVATAWTITSRSFPAGGFPDACVRAGVAAFAVVVLCALVLGALGRLTFGAFAVAQSACLAGAPLLPRGAGRRATPGWRAIPLPVVAIVGAVLVVSVAFAATHSPLTLYDSLSYHLFFAGRWLQDRALSIIPTPFSDEAQAYAPANGELFFLWLMLPFHGDLLARMGQFPFALLAAAALYAIGRRLGATPATAMYPPAFFLLARPVLEEAIGANVDLVCAAMFLASLYLGVIAVDRNDRRDWVIWGVSLGLFWGSKYLALAYTPAALLVAVARGPRARASWALPGVAAFALPWYLRNWIVAGSPIYPASLQVAGLTLARGAFTCRAMVNSVFHTRDVRLVPVILAHAFGPTLFVVWAPFAVVGAIALVRRGWWPHGLLVLVPALMLPLFWFGLPVNIDSRFLMPALGPALVPLAFAFGARRRWNASVHVVYTLGLAWIVAGLRTEVRAAVPWFMQGWLALNGLVRSAFLPWVALLAVLVAVVWRAGARAPRWRLAATAWLCAIAVPVLAAGSRRWCPDGCDYLDTTPTYIRMNLVYGWRWMADHVQRSTVAYTGINLPYPLSGRRLTNRVVYVNIDGRPTWRFDNYDRAYRAGRFRPLPPVLAASSGELRPVAPRPAGPRDDAVRPRYERMQGIRTAWLDNLQRLHVDYLFVSALSAYELDDVWHDAGGFPIEDAWARADPRAFEPVYDNPQVHVYRVAVNGP